MFEQRLAIRDLAAAVDQADAELSDVARMLGRYRQQLIENGFDPDEAFELVCELQTLIFQDEDVP